LCGGLQRLGVPARSPPQIARRMRRRRLPSACPLSGDERPASEQASDLDPHPSRSCRDGPSPRPGSFAGATTDREGAFVRFDCRRVCRIVLCRPIDPIRAACSPGATLKPPSKKSESLPGGAYSNSETRMWLTAPDDRRRAHPIAA
jgi:hypothetical protein